MFTWDPKIYISKKNDFNFNIQCTEGLQLI